MPGTTIRQPLKQFSATSIRHTATHAQAERMEARISELNIAHDLEIKRLSTLFTAAQKKLLTSASEQKG